MNVETVTTTVDKEFTAHLLNRKKMFWSSKGVLNSISNLDEFHIRNIINIVKSSERTSWQGFSREAWITSLNCELRYRESRLNYQLGKVVKEFTKREDCDQCKEGIMLVQSLII